MGEYDWVQSTQFGIHNLITACPDVVVRKCVVITRFDWGPLTASQDELDKGWEQHGELVVVPAVINPDELPYEQGDEWYVFEARTVPKISEYFVNEGSFTLKEPQVLIADAI